VPRGDAPHPTTELLLDNWTWLKWAGAAAWGIALALITRRSAVRLGAAALIGMVAGDSIVFGALSAALAPLFPTRLEYQPHVEMAVTFPFAAATVVMVTGAALAIAVRSPRLLPLLTIGAALAAAGAIVITVVLLDATGIRTGTGALAMPKVMVLGTVAACAAVGAIQAATLTASG
jgi:hypothetical protein